MVNLSACLTRWVSRTPEQQAKAQNLKQFLMAEEREALDRSWASRQAPRRSGGCCRNLLPAVGRLTFWRGGWAGEVGTKGYDLTDRAGSQVQPYRRLITSDNY